jgi:hypothetical protein
LLLDPLISSSVVIDARSRTAASNCNSSLFPTSTTSPRVNHARSSFISGIVGESRLFTPGSYGKVELALEAEHLTAMYRIGKAKMGYRVLSVRVYEFTSLRTVLVYRQSLHCLNPYYVVGSTWIQTPVQPLQIPK